MPMKHLVTEEALPVVHRNGTSSDELISLRAAAMHECRLLLDALRAAYPNMRDYYPIPSRWPAAQQLWNGRIEMVTRLLLELEAECARIDEIADGRP